jgi:hypothetical protein
MRHRKDEEMSRPAVVEEVELRLHVSEVCAEQQGTEEEDVVVDGRLGG